MDINEIYVFQQRILNKFGQGSAYSPSLFNEYLEPALNDFLSYKYGLTQAYQNGRPQAAEGYDITQDALDDLLPLKQDVFVTLDAKATMAYPNDYVHTSAILLKNTTTSTTGNSNEWEKVQIISDQMLGDKLTHPNHPPTLEYPVCSLFGDRVQYYPTEAAYKQAWFIYLRYPKIPFWASVPNSAPPVYDPTNSIQLELPANTHVEICRIMLGYMGISMRDPLVSQYAETLKREGM